MSETSSQKPIAIWLLICCATVFSMVVLGGVTRLSGSGLSMVEWAPIQGALPPLNQTEWQEAFKLYQQYPEFLIKNHYMELDDFKSIFWFEYSHRLLGRGIGLLFFIPFMFFLVTGKIQKTLTPKLVFMFVLGGLQGLMGWYMVKSGLVDNPHVSQYRLTAHMSLAIIIYAYMFWVAMGLLSPKSATPSATEHRKLARFSLIISFTIFLTIVSGAFVAGTRAGFAFNTFPLMDGRLIPVGLFNESPLWRNFFENIVTVQFNHRIMATVLFMLIPFFWWKAGKTITQPRIRLGLNLLLAALVLQISLGISTLLLVVPIPLAAAHQAGALILLTSSLFVNQLLQRRD